MDRRRWCRYGAGSHSWPTSPTRSSSRRHWSTGTHRRPDRSRPTYSPHRCRSRGSRHSRDRWRGRRFGEVRWRATGTSSYGRHLVLAQTPPPAAPIHTRSGLAGSQTSAVQRPPILVGPASCHAVANAGAAWGIAFCTRLRSAWSFASGASRNGQVTRAPNQATRLLCRLVLAFVDPGRRALLGPRSKEMVPSPATADCRDVRDFRRLLRCAIDRSPSIVMLGALVPMLTVTQSAAVTERSRTQTLGQKQTRRTTL